MADEANGSNGEVKTLQQAPEEAAKQAGEALAERLKEAVGDGLGDLVWQKDLPEFAVEAASLHRAVEFLHGGEGLNHLVLLSTVDRLDRIDVVYYLDSMPEAPDYLRVCLRVTLDRENPRVPSLTPYYKAADWHEREAYDLMGVLFDGHPNLTRIMLPEVWEGHPLRKDYRYDSNTMVEAILEDELGPLTGGRR